MEIKVKFFAAPREALGKSELEVTLAEGATVTDLIEHVQLSRSTLEARFKALLGRTIHTEIRRVQLEYAKNLVAYSDLSLKQIATRSGFSHVQHMTNIFRQHVGQTPGEYRKHARWRNHVI